MILVCAIEVNGRGLSSATFISFWIFLDRFWSWSSFFYCLRINKMDKYHLLEQTCCYNYYITVLLLLLHLLVNLFEE